MYEVSRMQEFQPMKLICSIATIIEGGKARWYVTTPLQSLALFVQEQEQKPRYESGCAADSPTSLVVWRARGARTGASKIENNKTQQTTIEF